MLNHEQTTGATLQEKVLATVREHGMFDDHAAIVVGLSGGADSLALAQLLAELRHGPLPGLVLHAAHLHHCIRGADADADADFCAATAKRLGIGFTLKREDIPLRARVHRENEEAAGREARYEFLRAVARKTGAECIATGHHADDQAETVLMRILRGAGPRGLRGIPYTRGDAAAPGIRIIRPLLDCTRLEIASFLHNRGLVGRFDQTNLSAKYLRNRIRQTLLPALAQQWPGPLQDNLLALARAARKLHAHAQHFALSLSKNCVILQPGYVETEAGWLRRAGNELRPELIRCWMAAAGLLRKMLARTHYERIASMLENSAGEITLPGEVLACCSGDRFILCAAHTHDTESFETPLAAPGITAITPLGMMVQSELMEAGTRRFSAIIAGKESTEDFLDYDCLKPPLTLRFPRPGDKMRALGAPGTRKVYDILADLHVPQRRRPRTLILTAAGVPVWLAEYRIAHTARITSATRRALRLRIADCGLRS